MRRKPIIRSKDARASNETRTSNETQQPIDAPNGRDGPWFPVQNEEFPEGSYGSPLYSDDPPGKVTPWVPGERGASAYQDENPAFSEGPVPPPDSEPPGSEDD